MYTRLYASKIVETAADLRDRVRERFPRAGLAGVAEEVLLVARGTDEGLASVTRPHWPIRLAVGLLLATFLALVGVSLATLDVPFRIRDMGDLVQVTDAALNQVIVFGLGIAFLVTAETRVRRYRVLRRMDALRSLAHVIDMHQLTKDPEQFHAAWVATPSSPQRPLSAFELARYLDYCSELLSLVGKLAALYAQEVRDPMVLTAVTEIEALSAALSQKVWQKLVILRQTEPRGEFEIPAP